MPLSHHLHRPFTTADIEEKPTDKRQDLEMERAKLRVEHRGFLSDNLAAAKARMENDLASALSEHLTDLNVKSWEEKVAYNPQRTPPMKTGSKIPRARGGHSITRSTLKRKIKQSAGVTPKPTAITSHLQRRRNILCMATKLYRQLQASPCEERATATCSTSGAKESFHGSLHRTECTRIPRIGWYAAERLCWKAVRSGRVEMGSRRCWVSIRWLDV